MQKDTSLKKGTSLPKSELFESIRGDLAIRMDGKLHKLCASCTKLIVSDKRELKKHWRAQHHEG